MKREEVRTIEDVVQYLYEVPKFTQKHTLEDTRCFLNALVSEENMGKIIHVAGTNGKGSVCAYLQSVLIEAGYKVGMFTSPHLIDVRERFLVNGEMVTKEETLKAFFRVAEHIEQFYHPTFFEFLFLMGMVILGKQNLDFLILETGLGGRLDATNVFENPAVCVITSIGLDHTMYLGNTVEKIAFEKAGIIKNRVPVVFADSKNTVTEVIERVAKEKCAKSYKVSKDDYHLLKNQNKTIDFSCTTRYYGDVRLHLNTSALYQTENASLAMQVLDVLGSLGYIEPMDREILYQGFEKCIWQGRMEEIEPHITIDGAHNPAGMEAFLESVRGYEGSNNLLVFGAVADKEYEKMLSMILESGLFNRIILTPIQDARTIPKAALGKLSEKCSGYELYIATDSKEALSLARRELGEFDEVFVAGSLYLVGEIKALAGGNQNDKF